QGQGQQQQWGEGSSTSRGPSPFRFPARDGGDAGNSNSGNAPFLFPQQQRHRSKSDNALEPPGWDTSYVQQQLQHQSNDGNSSALGLDLDNANDDQGALGSGSSTNSMNTG